MQDIIKIQQILKEKQSAGRFLHTLGVQYTSACLAMRYNYDISKAEIAGLLHDCAKHLKDQKKISLCRENDIEISDVEYKNPFLLHAQAGMIVAANKYGINDEDILMAIRYHTTGRPGMSLLEKIVFTADYIEPNRKNAPNLAYLRKLSFEHLDQTILLILEQTLEYLGQAGQDIDQSTVVTYNYYKDLLRRQ